MSTDLPSVLLTVTATGAGLTGGVFMAFSTFVMTALRRLPAPEGIGAMQQINRAAPQPLFMLVLLGTAALGTVIAVLTATGAGRVSLEALIGGLLSLTTAVITVALHVPRNNTLARVAADALGADRDWQHLSPNVDPRQSPADLDLDRVVCSVDRGRRLNHRHRAGSPGLRPAFSGGGILGR